jgi:two-component system, NarL family, sensor histidine kinase DesK
MTEVQELARDALGDVRAAVSGYRETSLAGELVAARAALDAAGIEAELPGAVDHVPGERRELFGWVVREGVTNVVRHSRATRCRVVLEPDAVLVADDGAGPQPVAGAQAAPGAAQRDPFGHGLAGLGERAEASGASLRVDRSDLGGFALRVGW